MRILIIYFIGYSKKRATVDEHLYSFSKYSKDYTYYVNAFYNIPKYILKIKWDIIIYHYTFISLKWGYADLLINKYKILKELSGYKCALPQDEYINLDFVCRFFKEYGVKMVFTILDGKDAKRVYPKGKSGLEYYIKVLPGYIDEKNT